MERPSLREVYLVTCLGTTLEFDDASFEITHSDDHITIARDADNQVVIRQKTGLYESESSIEGGLVLSEEKKGHADHGRYFTVNWGDESLPRLTFSASPARLERRYGRGQSIELGLEDVSEYRVAYRDGVGATFRRIEAGRFEFSFSTGLYGSFSQEPDDSFTLKFKGDRLQSTEEADRSQSKFIVSRSKYSGNLLLILQDAATVTLL